MIDTSTLQIRRMRESDAPLLAAAFADMNKMREQYERYWQENVEGKRVTLVALLSGSVVGYTNVIWEPDYEPFRKQRISEINDMNTVTSLRKNGIGTRMIAAAEDIVRRSGRRAIGIGIGITPDYAIAQRLYPKLGYVPDGTGVHDDAWGGCSYSTKTLTEEDAEPAARLSYDIRSMEESRLMLPIAKQRVPMHTAEALLDFHERAHRNLTALLTHCRELSGEEMNRALTGFGYPTVRLQLHHGIGAEKYWVGVLQCRIDADDDSPDYPTVESLEVYRKQVFTATEAYLRASSVEELNTPRPMMTWGNKERVLTPAHVLMRTVTHLYHHQGQIVAMCRLLGKPCTGVDYPIT